MLFFLAKSSGQELTQPFSLTSYFIFFTHSQFLYTFLLPNMTLCPILQSARTVQYPIPLFPPVKTTFNFLLSYYMTSNLFERLQFLVVNSSSYQFLLKIVQSALYKRTSYVFHEKTILIQMNKKNEKTSPVDGLTKQHFIYFGLGAVLYSVSQAFWINFAPYFLINQYQDLGTLIFLIGQIFEGLAVLLSWILIAKLQIVFGNHMGIYLVGTIFMMVAQPIIFLPGINNFWITLIATILAKTGSAFCIFSQVTMVSMLTNSRSRRKKLVNKITEFGLGTTFIIMALMTIVSKFMPFSYKFLLGVCIFVVIGGLSSIAFMYKIRQNQLCIYTEPSQITMVSSVAWSRQPRFYLYGIITVFGSLYMGIISAVFPYFVKYFGEITQFKYLVSVALIYFFSFVGALASGKLFMFTGIRTMISIGMACSVVSMIFYVLSYNDEDYGSRIYIGASISGISKIILSSCIMNLVNQMIGVRAKSREMIHAIYMSCEKIVTGIIISVLINAAMMGNSTILNFSWIYIPFILYFCCWLFIVLDRSVSNGKMLTAQDKKVRLKIENMDDIVIH